MKSIERVFLVGGAVRDLLMGRDPKDRDYVVVGETCESMLARGFSRVGEDFPVFLHPETGDEYALARTEVNVAEGYKGFTTRIEGVSLEQDLARRDLTINAMAMEGDRLIDPFDGRGDIEAGVLRHVGEAFGEDPVRVLRAARFAARYGFEVAPETTEMMRRMVERGDLDALTPERVCLEMIKVLGEDVPSRFFRALESVGALRVVFPELHGLVGVPQPVAEHPEGDAFEHSMLVLDQCALLSKDKETRFAALVHDLGKADTPADVLPEHPGHELAGVPRVEQMCARLKLPNTFLTAGRLACTYHTRIYRVREERDAGEVVAMMRKLKANHTLEHVERLAIVGEADAKGRGEASAQEYPQADLLLGLAREFARFDALPVVEQARERGEVAGPQIAQAVSQALCRHMSRYMQLE